MEHAIYDLSRTAKGLWVGSCECGWMTGARRLESRANREAVAHVAEAILARIENDSDPTTDPLGFTLAVYADSELRALVSTLTRRNAARLSEAS